MSHWISGGIVLLCGVSAGAYALRQLVNVERMDTNVWASMWLPMLIGKQAPTDDEVHRSRPWIRVVYYATLLLGAIFVAGGVLLLVRG